MIFAILIFLVFFIMAVLMYLNKLSALLSLPIMAVLISLIAKIPLGEIIQVVIQDGILKLNAVYTTVIFGAALAQVISKSGVAETIVKKAAELGGDRPLSIAFVLSVVIALLFTTLGGLGAVIMVATIVFPIMLSIGITPMACGCIFLLSLSLGGCFNLTNWKFYIDFLKVPQDSVLSYAIILGGVFFLIILIFLFIEIRKSGESFGWSVKIKEENFVPFYALITPLIPLGLVLGFSLYNKFFKPEKPFEFPIIPAMIIGLIYGVLTTKKKDITRIALLTRSLFEGISDVAPAVFLMMGIGMLLNAVMHKNVSGIISPLLSKIIPQTTFTYILFFFILAPLALYRGPLNLWGMGSGIAGIMLATKLLRAEAIMAALMSVGMIQGVCDPTNTHNVWIANYLNLDVQKILRKTLPYMWFLALIGLIIAGVRYF